MGSGKALKAAIKRRGADRFIKNVIREFDSSKAAMEHEIYLHNKYEVGTDPRSYNLCKQTSTGFDFTGVPWTGERRAKLEAIAADPDYLAKQSERSKRLHADPEYRAKLSAAMADPEYRAKQSETSKRMWADPEYRAKQQSAMKAVYSDPEYRAKQSERSKRVWASPERRANQSEKMKRSWADPEYHAKHAAALASPERRANQSEKMKRSWASPERRAKHAAALASPECNAKKSSSMKRKWADPEYLARMTVTCPHCGKTGYKPSMKRWHFNNCKQRSLVMYPQGMTHIWDQATHSTKPLIGVVLTGSSRKS
jgi:hypothetical protein